MATPRIIYTSALEAEFEGEETTLLLPPPPGVLAHLELELWQSGAQGYVDLETGAVVIQDIDWYDFTERFMDYCERFHLDRNYCRLAVAMKKADEFLEPWEYYIGFARLLAQHYEETHDTRLMHLKSTLEGSGWKFTYLNSEFKWLATCPGIEIQGHSLKETIENITTYGIPTLQMWEEHRKIRSKAARDGHSSG